MRRLENKTENGNKKQKIQNKMKNEKTQQLFWLFIYDLSLGH